MGRISFFIMAATATISTATYAQDWQVAARTPTDDVYVDATTIQRTGQTVRFWSEYRHRVVRTLRDGTRFDLSRSLIEADCDDKSYVSLQNSASFDGQNVIPAYRPNDGMRYAEPGTVIASEIDYVCNLTPRM